MYPVRGYQKPEATFHTISEWEAIANEFLVLQKKGYDVRGGMVDDNAELVGLINKYFGYQLYIETELYSNHTKKNVLDFIEDFINHRVWGLSDEFAEYIVNIDNDKIAFFQSRGAIEPYILLDKQFTEDTYKNSNIEVITMHWTSTEGMKNLVDSLQSGYTYALSTFTVQEKAFFRPESNVLVKLKGKLVAAFQSDVKSFATDKGNRAANLFRFSYPDNENNLCKNWDECKENKTSLWNEIIVKPISILDYKIVTKY
jgi:hypothetical protein